GRQGHELLGTGNRECSQNECVEQAAYCRGRANSQRQRDDDDQGERRSPSQAAEGVPNVEAECIPHAKSLAVCPALLSPPAFRLRLPGRRIVRPASADGGARPTTSLGGSDEPGSNRHMECLL